MKSTKIEWVSLGELMDAGVIQATTGFPFGGHNDGGEGVPHIRPFNVGTDGDIYLKQIKSIPTAAAAGKPKLQLRDIVFNNTNTKELAGKCALWSSELQPVFSNHMTRIRVATPAIDPAFLSFAILHHWMAGKSEMLARSHVAQASIIGSRFREIEVPRLPFVEQRTIGAFSERVRTSSRSEAAQLKHAKELKRTTMNRLFTRGLRGDVQKDSDIGPIPESWLTGPITAHHSVVSGGTPSREKAEYWKGGAIPWVKTTEVDYCTITETEEHITPEGLAKSAAKMLPIGTLLMAMYGQGVTRGKVAILGIEAACNQACAAITPTDKAIAPRFLYHFLTWRYDAIRSLAHGGQQQNLNLEIVRTLPVSYPKDEKEQSEIVEILDAIDRKIDLHKRKRAVLEDLFRTLLHKLMTGEIDVTDLDLSALPAANA